MMESKRVEFQFEVEGMQDLELEEERSLNATVEEFKEQSKMVKRKVTIFGPWWRFLCCIYIL